MKYRNYIIEPSGDPYNLVPWAYYHKEYDGAIDSGDTRYGAAGTIEECKEQIDELWDL